MKSPLWVATLISGCVFVALPGFSQTGGAEGQCNVPGPDCNGNGISDICDVLNGTSRDCNTSSVTDLFHREGAKARISPPIAIVDTFPVQDQILGVSRPEIVIDFSGLIDPATATNDSVRLYGIGAQALTPGPDDTLIPLSSIEVTPDGTRLQTHPLEPLTDGRYALVVYGTQSDRSGPGNGLYFSRHIAYLDTAPFKTLGEEFTIEAWTRFDDWSNYGSHTFGAVFDVGQGGRYVPGFFLSHERGDVHFGFRLDADTAAHCTAFDALAKGVWRHLAGVSSTGGFKIYVDGLPAASMPDTFRPDSIADSIEVAMSGYSRWAGAYDYVLGMFDEMRVWSVTRTQQQIQAAMHTPLSGDEPGLLIYHPLDQESGEALLDVSGHGFDGNRNGTPRQTSDAPLIEMASVALTGADLTPVDVDGDGASGGVLLVEFTVDSTGPRVMALEPDLVNCTALPATDPISVAFDDELNAATLTAGNARLVGSGGDGTFDDGNEFEIPLLDPVYDANARTVLFEPVGTGSDDMYRFELSDSIENAAGVALDGEYPGLGGLGAPLPTGDGMPGGSFTIEFLVDSAQDCDENGVIDTCELINGPVVPPAGAIRNPANGHYYLLSEAMTWAEAETLAVSMGGHLATIRSASENQWLFDTFLPLTGANQVFIGCSDLDVEDEWVWTSGEPMPYTNWASGQPDNVNNEGVGELTLRSVNCCAATTWNDRVESTVQEGIIEIVVTNDCNSNGVLDECDIADSTSNDCNANGILDECEPGGDSDCNNDGETDLCAFSTGTSVDCNQDGIPDDCQLVGNDCNENSIPDDCELAGGGSALDFDGADDWVRIPRTPLLEPTDELTIEVWIRPDSIGSTNNSRIVRIANSFGAGYILSWRQSGSSKLELRIDGASSGACRATDPTPVSTYFGQWIHVAGVYSATQNICKLYVNGVLKADKPAVGTLSYSGSDLFIGNHVESGEDFDGLIDEVRIWDVARTQPEIMGHMDAALLGSEFGLVGYWRFNEASGQTVFDSSPHGHDGTLGNSADPAGDGRDPLWTSEGAPIAERDCNGNGILDECDITNLTSDDCNTNGIPDECEPDADCNTNGVQDICDLAAGTSDDCNASGVPDDCELVDNDCNGNGMPDECEDCNNNGLADSCDLAAGTSDNCNANDIPDECEPDCNTNGVADECDIRDGTSFDFDLDGIPDECKPDCNGNGFPDFLDIAFAVSFDCNANMIPDECDLEFGASPDCNANNTPDECDIADEFSGDCDADGIPDECEPDADLDSIPDDCDALGDWDHDADIDLNDYMVLSICLDLSGPNGPPPFLNCLDRFDFNGDGVVGLADFAQFSGVYGQ